MLTVLVNLVILVGVVVSFVVVLIIVAEYFVHFFDILVNILLNYSTVLMLCLVALRVTRNFTQYKVMLRR